MLWSLAFWKGAAERAVKTFAQVLLGYVGVEAVGIGEIPWEVALSVASAATAASLLTSIANPEFVAGVPYVGEHRDDADKID